MNRPAFAVLLVSCVLLFGLASMFGTVAGQDGTAERSLNTTTVSPGETVEVTVTADLDGAASVDFADSWSPPAANSSVVSVSFDRGITSSEEVALFSEGEVSADSIEIVYTISVPADAETGTVYEWEPAANGDGSILSVGDDDRSIGGDQQFEVVADGDDDGTGDGDDGTDDGGTDDGGTDDGNDGGTDDGNDDGTDDGDDGGTDDGNDDGTDDGNDGGTDGDDGSDDGDDGSGDGDDGSGDGSGPGFGVVAVVLAAALVAVYSARRSESP